MNIKGETRPKINTAYHYTLVDPLHIDHFLTTAVDNTRVEKKTKWYESKPDKKEEVVTWNIYLNKKLVFTNTTGNFTFQAGNHTYLLEANLNGKKYTTSIITLGGEPKLEVYWRDDYGAKITGKTVGYLDKIYLIIKTKHIPLGDTLQVTIYEDELADGHGDSSRNMATFTTTPVNKNGYASIYFNNLQVFKTVLDKQDKINEDEHEFYAKIAYKSHINIIYDTVKDKELKTSTQLKVKNELFKYIDKPVNNMPVIVGEVETGGASENKKKVDFTFGVFLDGTLNNMYNTEVRKAAENKAQTNTSGLILSQADANKIYQDLGDPDDMESSYENDLSNPAILYKNYVPEPTKNLFKIYTEGVGTNSAPKKQGANMAKEDYKSDDLMSGPAFGMGSAGIMDGVKKAIIDAEKKISKNLKPNEIIGTITFDVFGFSRGAASARHFVHVVTHDSYKPTVYKGKGHVSVSDLQNNFLHPSYEKKTMPAFGLLGQLLKEKDNLDPLTKVSVRFAGLYDTVPHHGLFQWNDIEDLGLNSINKADYVVHFIAADEHRANFSLVDISSVKKTAPDSKEKGGIERYYPGVHCDVGGAYEEGRPDNPLRIDAADTTESLNILRQELIKQGWFKDKEIFTKFDVFGMGAIMNWYRLEAKREHISNQYSYIPLHHMAEICKLKNVPITKESVSEFKNFKENSKINGITGNVAFLNKISGILHDYTFSGGKPLSIIEPPRSKPELSNTKKSDIHEIAKDNTRVVKDVRLDIINDEVAFNDLNKDIRFLRNHYLHWNSTFGEVGLDIGVQKNYPRILNGKRERHVR